MKWLSNMQPFVVINLRVEACDLEKHYKLIKGVTLHVHLQLHVHVVVYTVHVTAMFC